MIVGAIQSNYIPWRGYFDLIRSVDVFILADSLQYTTRSYRNRAKLLGARGTRWMTVPVRRRSPMPIEEVAIGQGPGDPWPAVHAATLTATLGRARFFEQALEIWQPAANRSHLRLSALNADLIVSVCRSLGIGTEIRRDGGLLRGFGRTRRIVEMMKALGAKTYLSGPSARNYLEVEQFRHHGLGLQFKSYTYPPYPQQFGGFVEGASIIDTIANVGIDRASRYLRSAEPDEVCVPC